MIEMRPINLAIYKKDVDERVKKSEVEAFLAQVIEVRLKARWHRAGYLSMHVLLAEAGEPNDDRPTELKFASPQPDHVSPTVLTFAIKADNMIIPPQGYADTGYIAGLSDEWFDPIRALSESRDLVAS
ncbi:MAG: hypothetical protein AAF413_02720 [Patescibacteria group bacterium]